MKFLKKEEAIFWCNQNLFTIDGKVTTSIQDFFGKKTIKFKLPVDAGRKVAQTNGLIRFLKPAPAYLAWITEHEVWPSSERPHMFLKFREAYGEYRSINDAPACICGSNEIEDLTSILTFANLFFWDCVVIQEKGNEALFLSHDEYGFFYSISSERRDDFRNTFEQ